MRRLPNLDQLRAFALAARRMSFSRAADELHLTPTAISHRIRALEAELCRPLFRRKVRGVDMDDRAAAYADRLNAAFDEIAAATEDLLAAGMSGTLRINAAPYFGNRVLLPMLSKINATWPDLFIDLSMSTEIVDLTSGEYDAAIRHGSGDWTGVSAIHLYTDTLRPVAAPQLVADRTLPLSPQDIAAFRLSTRPEAALDWDAWFRAAGAPETRPRELVGFSSQAASPDLAL
ncbi:MAG: LysR substrate-binding domain-containing protein, partial [Pseudomonadota bacterium]